MSELRKFAKRDCPACRGRGVVRVADRWKTTALCDCLPRGWPRVVAAGRLEQGEAKKRAGLD